MASLTRPVSRTYPTLTKEGIGWRAVAPGVVEIHVDLVNDGDEPTLPAVLAVEAAALGAFIPFKPVTKIAVGSLEPGERRRAAARVDRIALPELQQLADAMTRGEWAGNINVGFEGRHPVEVHRALNLVVRAGVPVWFMFVMGEPATCRVWVTSPLWKAQVDGLRTMGILAVEPPELGGLSARVTVEVVRASDSKVVPVEFSFVTSTEIGESLGCVQA